MWVGKAGHDAWGQGQNIGLSEYALPAVFPFLGGCLLTTQLLIVGRLYDSLLTLDFDLF